MPDEPTESGLARRERAVAVIVSLVPSALSIGTFATDWRVLRGSLAIAGALLTMAINPNSMLWFAAVIARE